MKRRGFLGLLVSAPVAAKAAAGRAAAGLSGGSIGAFAPARAGTSGESYDAACAASATSELSWARDRVLDYLRELAGLESERPAMLSEARRQVARLDPDLADARSLSTATLIRLQAERDVVRRMEGRRSFLQERIDDFCRRYPVLNALT